MSDKTITDKKIGTAPNSTFSHVLFFCRFRSDRIPPHSSLFRSRLNPKSMRLSTKAMDDVTMYRTIQRYLEHLPGAMKEIELVDGTTASRCVYTPFSPSHHCCLPSYWMPALISPRCRLYLATDTSLRRRSTTNAGARLLRVPHRRSDLNFLLCAPLLSPFRS